MKILTLVFCLPAAALLAQAGPPPGYVLQWHDEFAGNTLDRKQWNVISGVRNSAVNTASAVSVTNGCLVISTYSAGGTNFTGFIDTKNKMFGGCGYYEASIQFSNAPGNWSAFWLQSTGIHNTNSNPADGVEMDIIEHRYLDKQKTDVANNSESALHYNDYDVAEVSTNIVTGKMGLASGFHTYGLLWTPESYKFYVDGRLVWEPTHYMISTSPEFIRLTSEVFDQGWAGNVPAAGYPGRADSPLKMHVDYVRYYAAPPSKGMND